MWSHFYIFILIGAWLLGNRVTRVFQKRSFEASVVGLSSLGSSVELLPVGRTIEYKGHFTAKVQFPIILQSKYVGEDECLILELHVNDYRRDYLQSLRVEQEKFEVSLCSGETIKCVVKN